MTFPSPQSAKTSVLAADLQIAGNVTSTGPVVFHAKIIGNIVADELAIEAGAEVQGDVKARRLKIDVSVA
jgi:cytoskeletal protein CcmA (bactofilin family)